MLLLFLINLNKEKMYQLSWNLNSANHPKSYDLLIKLFLL